MPAHRTSAPPPFQPQPPRKPSGFTPAVRVSSTPPQHVGSQPPRGRVFSDPSTIPVRDEEGEEEQQVEIINQPPPRFSNMPQGEGPLTKSGYPDRRYRGQRDLPPPEMEEERVQRARTGGKIGDVPVTIEGKPDRRFKENRALSEEELMAKWAEQVQERFGKKR